MKFLAAKRLVKQLNDGAEVRKVVLAANFETEAWSLYVQAIYAMQNIRAEVQHIDFGSLSLFMMSDDILDADVITFLCPWDVIPSLDWRVGYTTTANTIDEGNLKSFFSAIEEKSTAVVYFNVPFKPNSKSTNEEKFITGLLHKHIYALGCPLVTTDSFHLPGYFQTSQPVPGNEIGPIIDALSTEMFHISTPQKVIITDLDHTLWHGVIGEVGLEGIRYTATDEGYPHYIYQSLLKKLQASGVLLAAVSKNDQDLASAPFKQGSMLLNEDDFVAIVGNYEAKSAQIQAISEALDLPTSAFVFVDDNPVEIEEVAAAIPDIITLQFSTSVNDFHHNLATLLELCEPLIHTEEDNQRTELYRTRLKGQIHAKNSGANIEAFLKDLNMQLALTQKTVETSQRALQLINKTNQFNLNGSRLTEQSLVDQLNGGAELWSATLSDKHGSHGEVLACLVSDDRITHFVMSCRVLNRNVELAFLYALCAKLSIEKLSLDFKPTDRNTPFQKMLETLDVHSDVAFIERSHSKLAASSNLFTIEVLA